MASCPPPLHQYGTDDGGKKDFCFGRVGFGMPFQRLTGDTSLGDSGERVVSGAQDTRHKNKKRAAQPGHTVRAAGG